MQLPELDLSASYFSANTPWLVTGYGKYGLIFCTWRIWVMEKFEIWRGANTPWLVTGHGKYGVHNLQLENMGYGNSARHSEFQIFP